MKLPAQNIEAEESIIATILIENKAFEHCSDLMPSDFYKSNHQIIFAAMVKLFSSQQAVDLVTVTDELIKSGDLEKVGGPGYLPKLTDTAPVLNSKEYTQIIKDCSLTRQINMACMSVQDSSLIGEHLLDKAQTDMLKIQSNTNQDCIVNVRDIIQKHVDRIENANTQQTERGYKIGFPNIDRRLKLHGGKLIIIAGRPRMGKTSLSVTIARNLDKEGVTVGFLSIEMPEDEIMDRWIAIESNVDSSKFGMYKGLKGNDFRDLSDAASVLYESKIMIDETGSLDITDVERKARKMKKAGAQVLIIDQLSQIGNKYIKSGDTTALHSTNCNRLARLKKELKIDIFLLAQLNRNLENRANKEPMLADLKQTGSLEEDADAILFIHRPEEYAVTKDEKEALKGIAVINLAKNRSGPTYRDEKIIFVHETTHFYQSF